MKYGRIKAACYSTNVAMAIISGLSPLLFLTFRTLYGISFTLLGLLVLINFCTQLAVDLLFSFFSSKFNIAKTVKLTPVLTAAGFIIYAIYPIIFPSSAYVGIVIGTVIFAASGGLAEVLMSPTIAAIPSKNPEREMSKLHSIYAWGVVAVVIVSTVFLSIFGKENWPYLVMIWTLVPIISAILFAGTDIPVIDEDNQKSMGASQLLKNKVFLLSFFCMFMAGAAENTMSQWCSSYLEKAFSTSKVLGDIFGVAMFSAMLGIGRTLYAKFGKRIHSVMFTGAAGATVCYLIAALSGNPVAGISACALTGLCVSMLWPGNLIAVAGRFPAGGVVMYALMAAGGDLGGAAIPQLTGIITDTAMTNGTAASFGSIFGITADQAAMKIGMLIAAVFPLILTCLNFISMRIEKKK